MRLAEAIEANISAFLLGMGQAGGADERDDDEIHWTVGGSPLAYHNAVVRCSAPPHRADSLIDAWKHELTSRGLPGSWHLSPSMSPPDLAARLEAHGFVDTGDEPAMATGFSKLADPPSAPPLKIELVRDEDSLAAYRSVLAQGFGEGPREAEWVTEIWRRIGFTEPVPWRHYVGWAHGEAVSAASLLIHDGIGGIYFVGIIPSARRQGFGAAITHHAMIEARHAACSLAVLGASEMGYGVYRKLGSEGVFGYRLFELKNTGAD